MQFFYFFIFFFQLVNMLFETMGLRKHVIKHEPNIHFYMITVLTLQVRLQNCRNRKTENKLQVNRDHLSGPRSSTSKRYQS